MIIKEPISFSPVFQSKVWAGSRMTELYKNLNKEMPPKAGESWLFSDLTDGATKVSSGEFKGMTPSKLVDKLGASLCGTFHQQIKEEGFPLLMKIIDAGDLLSLQVHPDDDMALKLENEKRGKNESWYVIESEPGSHLILGPDKSISSATELIEALDKGDTLNSLHREQAVKGHCYSVPAGLLHSIGKGIMLAEIQQSSNTTYRVYDWGRLGMNGKPRTLHRDNASLCIDFSKTFGEHKPYPFWSDDGGFIELTAACSYYYMERIHVRGRLEVPLEDDAFSILLPLTDNVLITKDSTVTPLTPYTSCLIPAQWTSMVISSKTGADTTMLRAVPLKGKTIEAIHWRGNDTSSTKHIFF